MNSIFEAGQVYRRGQLHQAWQGTKRAQPQGGILTPAEAPLVLVVTGKQGAQHGYADRWRPDGTLMYYGAGQEGPMEFVRGNKALRDHHENGEEVHIFEEVRGGLRYRHQAVVTGWRYKDRVPDTNGDLRRAIVFELTPVDTATVPANSATESATEAAAEEARAWQLDLDELREHAARSPLEGTRRVRVAVRRVQHRSRDLRIYVLRRADGNCEGCENPAPFRTRAGRPYLEPHHTTRLSDGGPDHPAHVIGLCPACHRRVHHGEDGADYNRFLIAKLKQLEPTG